jgi:hypothetical protein
MEPSLCCSSCHEDLIRGPAPLPHSWVLWGRFVHSSPPLSLADFLLRYQGN